jgi:hypothetical protein
MSIEQDAEKWVRELPAGDTVEFARTILMASQAISLKRLADEEFLKKAAVRAVTQELADLDDLDRNNLHVDDVRAMLERILDEITA